MSASRRGICGYFALNRIETIVRSFFNDDKASLIMRTKGSSGPKTQEAIRQAGLELIYRHGYEATSLRQLAAKVGIREGSLYNHIASKQRLLFQLVEDHMDRLLAALEQAMRPVAGAEARLKAFIAFHLAYHAERPAEVFVINSELRSLDPDLREIIVAKRDRYEIVLIEILRDCDATDGFDIPDPSVAAKAILAMLTGVCTWFRPEGRLSVSALIALYTDLVMRGVRV
jgi:AcrR family transcriptional regulator